jgi:Flp pilus assembly pilin Flp
MVSFGVWNALRNPKAQEWIFGLFQYLKIWLELAYDCRAVTALEYGLIVAAIIVIFAGALLGLATSLQTPLTNLQRNLNNGL